MKEFKKICQMTQKELKSYVSKRLVGTHAITSGDGYVFAEGTFPVLLVAHLDTVHKKLPRFIFYDKKDQSLSSPNGIGGDDRCGVYMILQIVKKYNCSVLFCEDEEIGGIGAEKFVKTELAKNLSPNYIIEFDRKGSNDAVFYDCDNDEFEKFITKEFYKTSWGTFSDISVLAPRLKVAAVNLSCGYYKAHTVDEYVVFPEMQESIQAACKILERTTAEDKFEYVEAPRRGYYYGAYGYYGDYASERKYYDRYYDGYYDAYDDESYYLFEYIDEDGNDQWAEVWAISKEAAVGEFLMDHPDITFNDVTCIHEESTLTR